MIVCGLVMVFKTLDRMAESGVLSVLTAGLIIVLDLCVAFPNPSS
jgi:hypothetical protein